MIDVLSFFSVYLVLLFLIIVFGVSKFGHWGISKLLLGSLQLVLFYKIYQLPEININDNFVLAQTDLNYLLVLIFIQIVSFFLLPDDRQSFFKAALSCFLMIGLFVSISSNSLLIYFIAAQLAYYSYLGIVAMDKGGKVSLNSLRIFMKNEFYNGFFLLSLYFYLMATGSQSLININVQQETMFSLSAVLFLVYFLARIGVFPFHSNETDIIRTTNIDVCSFGLILLKAGLLYSSFKIFNIFYVTMNAEHLEYLLLVLRILGVTTIVYAGLISSWSKNFYDSLSYLYVVLMGFLAFVFSLEDPAKIKDFSFFYVIISGIGLVLFMSHSAKYLDKSLERVNLPADGRPIIWAIITLGIMLGIPAFPGFEIKVFIMKALVNQNHIPELLASCFVLIFGLQIVKFFRVEKSSIPNNYTVLKNTIGLQLYSAIVLLGLILFSINPALLLKSM